MFGLAALVDHQTQRQPYMRNIVGRGSDGGSRKRSKSWIFLLPLATVAATLLAVTKGSLADVSEIDAFQRAVSTQSKADALVFLRDFRSSHLTSDLIELLQPHLALEVCSSLSGGSSRVRAACEKVKKAAATAPAAGSPAPAPSASTLPADSKRPPATTPQPNN